MFDRYLLRKLDALERSRNTAGLEKMLRHNKSWVVSRAAGALVEMAGPGAVTALATALDGAASDVRVQLTHKLGQTKDAAAVAPLVQLLRAGDTADAAAHALGQIADAPAVTALVNGLVDGTFAGNPGELRHALRTGVRVLRGGEDDHEQHESIVARLDAARAHDGLPQAKSPVGAVPAAQRGVSLAAVQRVRELTRAGAHTAARDVLRDLADGVLSARDQTGRPWAGLHEVRSAAQHTAATLFRLEGGMEHNADVSPGGWLVGEYEEHALIAAFATLTGFLDALPDDAVADPAPQSPTPAPGSDALVVALMRRLLHDGDEASRRATVDWLREVGGPEAAAALREGLADPSGKIRRAALIALHRLGTLDSVEAVRDALADEWWPVRLAAVAPLGEIAGPTAVEALRGLLRDESPEVRRAAVSVLSRVDRRAGDEALKQAVGDRHHAVRWRAVELITELDDPTWAETLAPLLLDRHRHTRKTAASALRQWAWSGGDPEQRIQLAVACGEWAEVKKAGAEAAGPVLRMLTDVHAEGDVDNEEAVHTLQQLVAAHGERLPRQVLETGAELADPKVWHSMHGEQVLRTVSAAEMRRLCRQALTDSRP